MPPALQGQVMDALVSACGWMPLFGSLHLWLLLGCNETLAGGRIPLWQSQNLQPLTQKEATLSAANAAATVIGVFLAAGALVGLPIAEVSVIGFLRVAVMMIGVLGVAVTMTGVLSAVAAGIGVVLIGGVMVIGVLDAAMTVICVLSLLWNELQALQALQAFSHQRLPPLLLRKPPCQSLQLPAQPYRVLLSLDRMES